MPESTVYLVFVWRPNARGELRLSSPGSFANVDDALARARRAVNCGNGAIAIRRTINIETEEVLEAVRIFEGGRIVETDLRIENKYPRFSLRGRGK